LHGSNALPAQQCLASVETLQPIIGPLNDQSGALPSIASLVTAFDAG